MKAWTSVYRGIAKIAVILVLLDSLNYTGWAQVAAPSQADPSAPPLVAKLNGILLVPSPEEIEPAGVTDVTGLEIKGPDFLKKTGLERILGKYLWKPLDEDAMRKIQVEIIQHCKALGHPVVDVFYRDQEVLEGTVQIAVIEGKIGKVTVKNEGTKWFSDRYVMNKVKLRPEATVESGQLNRDLGSLSRNSFQTLSDFSGIFLESSLTLKSGEELGTVDVDINVKDRLPVRPFVGYDDAGFTVIGEQRLFAGFNWVNAFGLDHRANYQFVSDVEVQKYKAHLANYTIPLPWGGQELTFLGGYADMAPDFSLLDNPAAPTLAGIKQDGFYVQASARYLMPMPSVGSYQHELSAGFDFKRTDTPTIFGGFVTRTNAIDVLQFSGEYRASIPDPLGRTAFSVQGYYSPGDLTDRNTDAEFNSFLQGTEAEYWYLRGEIRRETPLPLLKGFSWTLNLSGQYADERLTPSETFGVGGHLGGRGYDERTLNGDSGWMLVNEIRTPRWVFSGSVDGKRSPSSSLQLLAFCDYGAVYTSDHVSTPGGFRYNEILLSVGGGVRYQFGDNLRFRLDYGYQLNREYLNNPLTLENQSKYRVHLGLELSL